MIWSSGTPSTSQSPNVLAVLSYISAMEEWDFEKILAHFDETLQHQVLPTTLGHPLRNKKEYTEYFDGVIPMFRNWTLTIHELIEAGDKIVIHASSIGESSTGAPYANQYTVIFHLAPPTSSSSDKLPKITRVKEFVDSLASARFFGEERARQAKKAQPEDDKDLDEDK